MLSGALVLAAGITLVLTGVLLAIAVIDLRQFRIPDALSLPLIAAGIGLAAIWPGPGPGHVGHHLIGAGAGFLLLAGLGEAFYRLRGAEGLGLGDAKLFAAAGAWLGWQGLPAVLLIAAGAGLVWALVRWLVWRRTGRLAFGPWLALGFWLCWLAGQAGVRFSGLGG